MNELITAFLEVAGIMLLLVLMIIAGLAFEMLVRWIIWKKQVKAARMRQLQKRYGKKPRTNFLEIFEEEK